MQMITRHFIDVPQGAGKRRVHYRKCGSGPALLMVHQSPRSSKEYEVLMREWGAHFTCIAADSPGFGQSDPLPPEPSINDFADANIALLDALGLNRVHAYGFHSGGIILVTALKRNPERFNCMAVGGYAIWTADEMHIFGESYLPPFHPSMLDAANVFAFEIDDGSGTRSPQSIEYLSFDATKSRFSFQSIDMTARKLEAQRLQKEWTESPRWKGVKRGYNAANYWTDSVDASGNMSMSPTPNTSDLTVYADTGIGGVIPSNQSEQLRIAWDADTYASINVDSDGVTTLRTSSVAPAGGAYLLLNPGGKVGVNTASAPNAQVEISSFTEQLDSHTPAAHT